MKLSTSPRGAALIIVLAFVLLLSGLITAYFARALASRKLSDSSFNQTKASQLAASATDIIVSDLKQEIAAGSNKSANDIYYPKTNADMLPRRSPAVAAGTPDPIPNLIRRSIQADPIASPGVPSRASAVSSTTASLNGRSISNARWNSHYLVPRMNTGITIDSTPIGAFTAPDWVVLTANGPEVLTAPSTSVIGRYAYAIYDEGGLLDVNVAGYPIDPSDPPLARERAASKSALAFADLTVLPTAPTTMLPQAQIDNLVGWRNYASAQPAGAFPAFTFNDGSATSYNNYVIGNQTGFRRVAETEWNGKTDQAFLSRQQLLAFRRATGFSQNVLQYLTTFTRDLEQPSYVPDPGRPPIVGNENNGGNNAHNLDNEINPSFLDVRGADGKPVVKRRFPLSRLALVTHAATAGTGDDIYNYFGLQRSGATAPWVYDHGRSGGGIMRLSEVAAATPAREPDMAELLKAALQVGSIAKTAKRTSWGTGTGQDDLGLRQNTLDSTVDFQVLQIMANIIDQYDDDSYPTHIQLSQSAGGDPIDFFGTEDLPYFSAIIPYAVKTGTNSGRLMMQPMIWNPHQTSSSASGRPIGFQITADSGSTQVTVGGNATGNAPPVTWSETTDIIRFGADPAIARAPTLVRDSANGVFSAEPAASQNAVATTSVSGRDLLYNDTASGVYFGFKSGEFTNQWGSVFSGAGGRTFFNGGGVPGGIRLKLWYFPAGSDTSSLSARRLYQEVRVPANSNLMILGKSSGGHRSPGYRALHGIDPRTTRFSWLKMGEPGQTMIGGINDYARSDTPVVDSEPARTYKPVAYFSQVGSGASYGQGLLTIWPYPQDSGFTMGNPMHPAYFAENKPSSDERYADPDGIVRRAMGAYADSLGSPSTTGLPLATDTTNSRPYILNRPFRSVAELGAVFRGTSWKNIDFFTPESGDATLLDVFTLRENTSGDSMVAGKVSLNTRQPKVLEAILAGALKDPLDLSLRLNGGEAADLAAKLVARTSGTNVDAGQGPMQNVAELVGRWVPSSSTHHGYSEDLTAPPYANSNDPKIKRIRESAIRALAGVGQTRVWNLMIDVIAQAGRLPPAASGLDQFLVEGEQRLWVHVAIDRLTGKVIDQSVEVIRE